MYYDNKSTFYIKQYGPAVCVIVISLVLVLSGLYIYLSSNKSNKPQDTLVAKNNTEQQVLADENLNNKNITQTNNLQDVKEDVTSKEDTSSNENKLETKEDTEVVTNNTTATDLNQVKISTVLTAEIKKINKLEKLNDVTVLGINDDMDLVITISDQNYKVDLIGIDYKKSPSNIKNTINTDLSNKKVTLVFDNVKIQDSKLYAYVYINDNLYNENLLKNGLATLKVEKANTSLLTDLVSAQKYAKENKVGIWKK